VWQTQLSVGGKGGIGGIQWGSSWDGSKLYVATHQANPGQLFALDPATGSILWHNPNPADGCTTGGAATTTTCVLALPAAVTTIPGVAFEGSLDGKLRAYNTSNGTILWQYDTEQTYTGTNGVTGKGGAINAAGATVTGGMVYVNSGYALFGDGTPGGVLLGFGLSEHGDD
jgi:polyvinyl alcohol dehydrogenase (cytochrome)